ncbi:MAG: hypothetical protein ACJ73E_15275, partial [Mycobacteriales bacterium]
LYWALTGLPDPLVDTRKAASAERTMVRYGFGWMADPARVWTADEMGARLRRQAEHLGSRAEVFGCFDHDIIIGFALTYPWGGERGAADVIRQHGG